MRTGRSNFQQSYPMVLGVVCVVSTLFGIFGGPRAAQADPHAMFYTAIGQRQLFFNMLAALDQADYVEPADGAPGEHSRAELVRKRAEAGFEFLDENGQPVSEKPTIKETQTELPSVLTRSITLEGYDLWTTYVESQFALEAKRRRDVNERARFFCTVITGHENCTAFGQERSVSGEEVAGPGAPGQGPNQTQAPPAPDQLARKPEEVRVVQPGWGEWLAQQAGQLILSSSLNPASPYQKFLRQAFQKNNAKLYKYPIPFDPTIAQIRDNLPSDPAVRRYVESLLFAQANVGQSGGLLSPDFFHGFEVDQDTGHIQVKEVAGENNLGRFTSHLSGLVSNWAHTSMRSAEAEVNAAMALDKDGFHPTVDLIAGFQRDCSSGECAPEGAAPGAQVEVKIPASNKAALAQVLSGASVDAANNQVSAAAVEESITGETPLVYREAEVAGAHDGSVRGAQDRTGTEGRVLHGIDPTEVGDLPRSETAKSLTISGGAEQGHRHVDKEVFGHSQGGNDGCGCSVQTAAGSHTLSIAAAIAQLGG